ncbi:MAG: GNAT family protein [Firmicutes bacterium]|nr:GNAT family protein [Bacillota bacterium]
MSDVIKYLQGEKVYLRCLEPEDANDLYRQVNNDLEGRRFTGTQRPFTRHQIESYIEGIPQDSTRVQFGIFLQENDRLIGDVAIMDMDNPMNRSGIFRIAIDTQFAGQGYGTEATNLTLDYGFGTLNLHRIQLDVYSINERAIHVYEKVGFKREGVLRDAHYYNNAYYDTIIMSILEDEYQSLHGKRS